ncbi:efflux RND transporter periplasmic adaptor subunit [Sphingomonas sp. ac-8]|uniref:efflux RND transporter periplasmic adaptor subunit n=1 Tax=Sphingomonas sp. ac-8 TaxID=3242977 RepID=UPI003A8120FE
MIIAPSFGRPGRTLVVVAGALALSGCGGGAEQPPAPPPPLVTAITVQGEAVPNIIELPGRIEAVRSAEVRARTDGIIERRLYQEGTDVKAGTPLFRIDPRDKQAQLAQARAALSRAQATRTNAKQIVDRYRPLIAEKAVSAQEYDAALATLRGADADVADARAAVSRAELELSYTTVRAPISGRVGRAQVTEGALASAASATLLTTVEQLEPVYAVFTESSSALQDLANRARSGALALPSLSGVEVRLVLENGTEYPVTGRLNFADLTVDPTTGSQVLRATFANPARQLLPGQFIRGRITAGTTRDGVQVPARAVQLSNEQATVMVVGKDGTVAARTVELGGQVGSGWVVRSGLKPGEQVITEGWQKVQPGQKVRVQAPQAGAKPAQNGQPAQGGQPAAGAPRGAEKGTAQQAAPAANR